MRLLFIESRLLEGLLVDWFETVANYLVDVATSFISKSPGEFRWPSRQWRLLKTSLVV